MSERIDAFEQKVIERLRRLPENKKIEALDFIDYLAQRFEAARTKIEGAVSSVESSWASINLDKETLKFVAEDKELEYEF